MTKTEKDLLPEFIAVLGIVNVKKPESVVQTRLIALGHSTHCGRCGGGGHHSYCQSYGTTCFTCHGNGLVCTKLTKTLLATVKAQVERGELEPYLTDLRAKQERRAKVKGAAKRISDAWEANPEVAKFKGLHFMKQSERCNSINQFVSPLYDEAHKLILIVEKGEWSKEKRAYVPVSSERQDVAIARIAEIEELVANAEMLAPDVAWDGKKFAVVELTQVAENGQ